MELVFTADKPRAAKVVDFLPGLARCKFVVVVLSPPRGAELGLAGLLKPSVLECALRQI